MIATKGPTPSCHHGGMPNAGPELMSITWQIKDPSLVSPLPHHENITAANAGKKQQRLSRKLNN